MNDITDKLAERAAFEKLADDYASAAAKARLEGLYGTSKSYTRECQREADDARAELMAWFDRAALEAEAKPAPAEPVAWGMRDKTTGLILDVICPDEHDSHEGDYTIPLYAAPAAPAPVPLEQKELERICYEHTKCNPNLADDRELVGYVTAAMRAAIEASKGGGNGNP